MSFEQKNKNWLTPLLRWISGEATRHDEQSLDGLAKDDPFLADALDGYRSQADGHHAETVTRLKANLRRRTRKQRGAGFYVLRVAAIGAVLVAAWFVFQQFNQSETMQADSMEITQEFAESPVPESTPAPAEAEPEILVNALEAPSQPGVSPEKNKQAKSKKDDQPAFADVKTTASEPAVADNAQRARVFPDTLKIAADAVAEPASEGDVISMKKELAETKKAADEIARSESRQATKSKIAEGPKPAESNAMIAPQPPAGKARTITGTVTDESGDPLIGANVLAKGTAVGAITDVDGNYSINVPAETSALQFAYVGYTTLEVTPGDENRLDVQLSESGQALSEIVVTGLGAKSSRKIVSPKPKGGFKKFEKYLQENMRRPDSAAATQASGVVTVRFRILKNGKLTDFQPTSSLSQEFMDEAVRLLKEGPEWRGEPGTFTTYSIRF